MQIGPQFVRDLLGTVESQKAELVVLITNAPPTRGMIEAADHSGTFRYEVNGHPCPRGADHHRERTCCREATESARDHQPVHGRGTVRAAIEQ